MSIQQHSVRESVDKNGVKRKAHTSHHHTGANVDLAAAGGTVSRKKPEGWTGLPQPANSQRDIVKRLTPAGFTTRELDTTENGAIHFEIESDDRPEAAWHFRVEPEESEADIARHLRLARKYAEEQYVGAQLAPRIEPLIPEGYALENGWFNSGPSLVSTTDDPNIHFVALTIAESASDDDIRKELASARKFIEWERADFDLLDRVIDRLPEGHQIEPDYNQEYEDDARRLEVYTPDDDKVVVTVSRGASDDDVAAEIVKAGLKLA